MLIGDHLYGFSSQILTAMRFDNGEIAWKDRSVGKGSLVFADGHLYCLSEDGVVGLVEATPTGYREKGRFRIQHGKYNDLDTSGCCGRTFVPARSGHDLRLRREREEIKSLILLVICGWLFRKFARFAQFSEFLIGLVPLFE